MTPAPRLALFTVVATLAYLGLAIVGSGGFALFFSHPALVALAVALFAMSGVALFSEGNLSPGEREDRGNRWGHRRLRFDRGSGRLSAGLHRPDEVLDP